MPTEIEKAPSGVFCYNPRMNRPLSAKEHNLLQLLIESLEPEIAEVLRSQLAETTVNGGKNTMLELSVNPQMQKIEQNQGPLPIKALVNNDKNEPVGELLLWTTNGYLSQLEYAWYTDQMPDELPALSQVIISRD
jgi:hypothetical protein